jgi:hypothetical protein
MPLGATFHCLSPAKRPDTAATSELVPHVGVNETPPPYSLEAYQCDVDNNQLEDVTLAATSIIRVPLQTTCSAAWNTSQSSSTSNLWLRCGTSLRARLTSSNTQYRLDLNRMYQKLVATLSLMIGLGNTCFTNPSPGCMNESSLIVDTGALATPESACFETLISSYFERRYHCHDLLSVPPAWVDLSWLPVYFLI